MGLTDVVPFLVENALIAKGAEFSKAGDFESHVVVDGLLICGQNPASAEPAALELISAVEKSSPLAYIKEYPESLVARPASR